MFTKNDQALNADNFSAENWDPEAFRELMLSDLDDIAGGRELRPSERAQLDAMTKMIHEKMQRMINEGNFSNASAYYKICCSGIEQYKKAVANAPEDGPDIPVSKYLNV